MLTCSACTPEIKAIIHERQRQDKKWGEQNHGPDGWLPILMEEVGEVAKAMLEGSGLKYLDELTQVAAVAVAAMESANRVNLEFGSLVKAQKELKALRKEKRGKP
jgi:NTP pyrophosphatase (non-canonical NTP hydrolase)